MSDGLLRTADGFRTAYRDTLGNVGEIVSPLDAASWNLPTGCPGWTVRDIVAHISALESILVGREQPAHTVPEGLEHVKNTASALTEIGVDHRRSWSIERLLGEFREVSALRLVELDSLQEVQLDGESRGFFGPAKTRNHLMIRLFDLYSHEQDIRRAVNVPGGLDGLTAHHARELLARGVASKTAQRLEPPDGTTVLLDITGPDQASRLITFSNAKGRVSDETSDDPTVTLRLDLNTLTILGCGRVDDPGARDRVIVEGDVTLARRILEDVASTP